MNKTDSINTNIPDSPTPLSSPINRRRLIIAGLIISGTGIGAIKIRKTIKDNNDIKSGRLAYSTKMGWVDMGHATPGGMQALLEHIKNPEKISGSSKYGKVRYAQFQGFHGLKGGVSSDFIVRRDMTKEELEAVAFTIFLKVSRLFEEYQKGTDWISGSAYHEADLVGNILGFYRAARGYSQEEIVSMAGVMGIEESLIKHNERSLGKNDRIGEIPCDKDGYCKYPAPFNQIRTIRIGKFYHGRILLLDDLPRREVSGIKFIGYTETGLERFLIEDNKLPDAKVKNLLLSVGEKYNGVFLLRKSSSEVIVYR